MLRFIADRELPYDVTLVYSNRDRESAAFLDELEELERRIDGLRVVLTMTDEPGWEGETRQLDADVLGELVGGLEGKTFLVAGPPADGRGRRGLAARPPGSPRSTSSPTSSPATSGQTLRGELVFLKHKHSPRWRLEPVRCGHLESFEGSLATRRKNA